MKMSAFSPYNDVYIQHKISNQKNDMPVPHYHEAYEFYLMLDGKRYMFYDNICHTLERGDLVVLVPFDIHYSQSLESDYFERYVLYFRPEDLSVILSGSETSYITSKLNPCVVRLSDKQLSVVQDYFEKIEGFTKREGFLSKKLLCSSIFQLVLYVTECMNNAQIMRSSPITPQIMDSLKYIEKNYKQNITLDDLSATVRMSKYHFCRTFKEATGATVIEYLNNFRLAKVHSLLINTKSTIETIAAETGFSSAKNLTRVFKDAYGTSPRAFRKEHEKHKQDNAFTTG